MKLGVFGTNEIGLTASAIFASHGHHVVCTDEDRSQIVALNSIRVPVGEEGLPEINDRSEKDWSIKLLSQTINSRF